ncbi:hypothetical protein [Nocardiopsis alba]|uniref:hypothetical protein n=1 Tax=Nocardiopsis alba TaxID=53437 RepID=UPI000346C465|nr:hypothetical protein [Nocardiopsis alba]
MGGHRRAAAVLSLAETVVPDAGEELWSHLAVHGPSYYAETRFELRIPLPKV